MIPGMRVKPERGILVRFLGQEKRAKTLRDLVLMINLAERIRAEKKQ
jgi:hypothetical protein